VFQREQESGAIEDDADRVEADHGHAGTLAPLVQPPARHLAHLGLLGRTEGFERAALLTTGSARLDLAEDERLPVVGHQVQLSPTGPVIALKDLVAATHQVLGCELLTGCPEALTPVSRRRFAAWGVAGVRLKATPSRARSGDDRSSRLTLRTIVRRVGDDVCRLCAKVRP
jgi:hypothetical protein